MTGAMTVAAGPIHVLVIGESPDSASPLQTSLAALQSDVEMTWSPALESIPDTGTSPDVIVLLQEHPDQASPQQVRDLLDAFPLSRLIVSYGPWCTSDGRTRRLWPDACRVPDTMLLLRLRHELAVVRGESLPLPLTADRDECWEQDFASPLVPAARSLTIAISTPDPAVAAWLSESLSAVGHRIASHADDRADVVLFDADPASAQRGAALAAILRTHCEQPIVALVGTPGAAASEELREQGVTSVTSKLTPLAELCRVLEEAADAPRLQHPVLQIIR